MSIKKIYLKELNAIHIDGRGSASTIFLSPKKTTTQNFRCPNCGNLLFQYNADIPLITDENFPDEQANIQIICERCKKLYRLLW